MALALSGQAAANDSSSELAAGGIVLVKNDDIAMQREDLTLSPSEVRVRYEMRNDSGKPVTLRVAFPMPEVPAWSPGGFHTATSPRGIMLPRRLHEPNFIGFRVWAEGRELTPEVEIRAALPDGRDIAQSLLEIGGLALVLRSGFYALPDDPELDAATRQRLSELGAIEELPDRAYRLPWTTRITFHWMQTFAPGVTVVEHSYRPILGFSYVGFDRQNGAALFAGPDADAASVFCIDAAGRQTLRSLGEAARAKRLAKGEPEFSDLLGYTLGYVLQTAKNWRGPIGTFHLTVKSDPIPAAHWTDGGPTLAAYFCSPVPLSQPGPLLKEGEARDFVPTSDLRILFVRE